MRSLTGHVQHYAWGSTDAIPAILGARPDGTPWAEYWLGAHRSAPSTLEGDGDLDAWLSRHPAELGEASRTAFGDRLSYLLKILSADQALSIQAHPSRDQAQAGFAAENEAGIALDAPERIFRDDWPKPEMIVALTPFDALCGFRDVPTSLELLAGLGPVEGLDELLAPLRTGTPQAGLARVLTACLKPSETQRRVIAELVETCRARVEENPVARTAVDLDRDHPGDPSILAALLMNRVSLVPGQCLQLSAGTMHAYLRGTGIEIMASSDNVLRGGLTGKHIDVDALLALADLSPQAVVGQDPQRLAGGVDAYRTVFPEFGLWRLAGPVDADLPASDLGRIVLVVEGSLTLATTTLTAGRAVWVAAGECVHVRGDGLGFVAAPGVG
ncbi:mannose-6-phosphate isomerase, class I [Acidipropionibacterium timonense]|uniref:mannose-6-phosphate isomerase, class I n=1 Tax=Acidipropionibacterium timonense TaxID=2161818 RepID=UPI001031E677|nr:mannose-6-phosphate isomerase, class I [Acidipropionibacterium timonense]